MIPYSYFGGDYFKQWGYVLPNEWDERIPEIIKESFPKVKTILDVGCGLGFLVKNLLDLGYEAKGVDQSLYASRKTVSPNNFIFSDVLEYSKDNPCEFDLVVCWQLFQFMTPFQITKLLRWSARTGALLLADWGLTPGQKPYQRTGGFYKRILKKCGYVEHDQCESVRTTMKCGFLGCEPSLSPTEDLVSVVIPFKDRFQLLVDTLFSVDRQTHRNKEIILVNDHSVGDAGWIRRTAKACSSDVTVFDSDKQGASAARNKGLLESCGDHVIFFDSDDRMPPEYMSGLLLSMDENTDVVYPRWTSYETDLTSSPSQRIECRLAVDIDGACVSPDFDVEALRVSNFITMPGLIKRETIDKFSMELDEKLDRYIDWDLWLNLAKAGARFRVSESSWFVYDRKESTIRVRDPRPAYERLSKKGHISYVPGVCFCSFDSGGTMNETNATTKIRAVYIARSFRTAHICRTAEELLGCWRDYQVFVFTRLNVPENLGWFRFLKSQGKKVVYDETMPLWMMQPDTMDYVVKNADLCITHNERIAAEMLSRGASRVEIIDDGVLLGETIEHRKKEYLRTGVVSWFGYAGNVGSFMPFAEEIERFCSECSYRVRIVSDRDDYCLPFPTEFRGWSHAPWPLITETDAVLLPRPEFERFYFKSQSKEYLAKALAMPVVVNDFYRRLRSLSEDERARREEGSRNIDYAATHCDSRLRAEEYIQAIQRMLDG